MIHPRQRTADRRRPVTGLSRHVLSRQRRRRRHVGRVTAAPHRTRHVMYTCPSPIPVTPSGGTNLTGQVSGRQNGRSARCGLHALVLSRLHTGTTMDSLLGEGGGEAPELGDNRRPCTLIKYSSTLFRASSVSIRSSVPILCRFSAAAFRRILLTSPLLFPAVAGRPQSPPARRPAAPITARAPLPASVPTTQALMPFSVHSAHWAPPCRRRRRHCCCPWPEG